MYYRQTVIHFFFYVRRLRNMPTFANENENDNDNENENENDNDNDNENENKNFYDSTKIYQILSRCNACRPADARHGDHAAG